MINDNNDMNNINNLAHQKQKWTQLSQSWRNYAKVGVTMPKWAQLRKSWRKLPKWAHLRKSGRNKSKARAPSAKLAQLCERKRNWAKVGAT